MSVKQMGGAGNGREIDEFGRLAAQPGSTCVYVVSTSEGCDVGFSGNLRDLALAIVALCETGIGAGAAYPPHQRAFLRDRFLTAARALEARDVDLDPTVTEVFAQ